MKCNYVAILLLASTVLSLKAMEVVKKGKEIIICPKNEAPGVFVYLTKKDNTVKGHYQKKNNDAAISELKPFVDIDSATAKTLWYQAKKELHKKR